MRTVTDLPLAPSDRSAIRAAAELLRRCLQVKEARPVGPVAHGEADRGGVLV